MPTHSSNVLHLHPSRPLDRGELEGLPGLAAPGPAEHAPAPWVDADAREDAPRRSARWPRPARVLLEATLGLMLLATLVGLLTDAARAPHGSGLRCPIGTSQAVMQATGCRWVPDEVAD